MLNIKQEIQILLLKRGLSMRKLLVKMKEAGFDMPASSNFSVMLSKKRIRFETVQEVLDFLGYEFKIVEKVSE
ncbi:TPA: hypothetical protein IAA68_08240 [Candidatus Galligastranaerophilus faecipullorum]|nr:hypothetical protein [Candidatus Galligastranaerophilus faecipullorum]